VLEAKGEIGPAEAVALINAALADISPTNAGPGDRVEFGPPDRPLSGEVSTVADLETIRRVPAGLARRSG
jgi:hypothetical protein